MAMVKRYYTSRDLTDKEKKNFAILDAIRKRGPIARTEITRLTGFNIVTVSNYIDHYIKEGLVSEEGYDISSGGRKPMLVNLNQKAYYVMGLGFDMTDVMGVITDLRCDVILEMRKPRPAETGPALVECLMDIVDELLTKSSIGKQKIKGIGVAVAGIIDVENKTVKWPGQLGTQDKVVSVSLWEMFTKRFGIPVIIENDADCAAFGEQWIALSPEHRDVIYMYSGVSCGIVINGQIYKGASGCAGEIGILNPKLLDKYDWNKESYGLGRWNMECGMLDNIGELYKTHSDSKVFKLANDRPEDVTLSTVLEAANAKDNFAQELLEQGGMDLGKKVAFLVNLLNPQIVVIGGGIERAGEIFIGSIRDTVKDWAFEEATRFLKIVPAQLAEKAVPLGAASLVIKNLFEEM